MGYEPLKSSAYPCSHEAVNGMIDGYPSADTACTFCDEKCEKPKVDDYIGFLDGFDTSAVGISYAILIPISIILAIIDCVYFRPKYRKELADLKANDPDFRRYSLRKE